MKIKLTFWQKWYMFWGMGYLVNHSSKEIHRVSQKHINCCLDALSKKTSEYVSRRRAIQLIRKANYNGCRWCWKGEDRG